MNNILINHFHNDVKIGNIPTGGEPVDIAVNSVTNKIYCVNRAANSVSVIDGADNSAVLVPTGARPIAVAINSVTNKIYVANYDAATVTIIDGTT